MKCISFVFLDKKNTHLGCSYHDLDCVRMFGLYCTNDIAYSHRFMKRLPRHRESTFSCWNVRAPLWNSQVPLTFKAMAQCKAEGPLDRLQIAVEKELESRNIFSQSWRRRVNRIHPSLVCDMESG